MKKSKKLISALLVGAMLVQIPLAAVQVNAENLSAEDYLSQFDNVTLDPPAPEASDSSVPKNEFGIDISVPSDFDPNDGENPYGDGWVNMTPTHELIMHEPLQGTIMNEGDITTGDVRLSYFNYDEGSSKTPESTSFLNPGNVGSTFFDESSTTTADINKLYLSKDGEPTDVKGGTSNYLHFARGIAYDPNGTGKDDHVAYYGFDKTNNYSSVLLRSKAADDPYTEGNKITLLGSGDNPNGEQYKYIQNVPWYQGEAINSIVAGDFDGDGKDTLIVFDPAANFGAIREFSGSSGYNLISYADFAGSGYSGSGFAGGQNYLYELYNSFFGALYGGTVDTSNAQYNMPYVHFAAGNLDSDPEDELVMTVSAGNITHDKDANFGNKSSFIVVLDKSSGAWTETYRSSMSNIKIDQIPNEAYPATLGFHMQSASSAIGDFSGNDGINEIITVGTINNQSTDNSDVIDNTEMMMAVVTVQTGSGNFAPALTQEAGASAGNPNQVMSVGHFLSLRANSYENFVRYITHSTNQPPLSLGLVQFDGVGTTEYIVAQGVIFKYESNAFVPAAFESTRTDITKIFDGVPQFISQPTIGSFSGFAGEESIMFSTWYEYGGSGMYVVGYHKQQDIKYDNTIENAPSEEFKRVNEANVSNGQLLSSWWYTASHHTTIPVLIAADYDDDQTMIRYKSKEYTFSDPEVMALLEVSPYFEDVDYDSAGFTEFGIFSGSGSGTGRSTEFSIGAFAGVDWENEFGNMGVQFSVGYSADIGTEWNTEEVFTRELGFITEHAEEHQVVMLAVPVTIYTYDQKFPNGNVSTMTLQMADAPRYSSIGISQYTDVQSKSDGKYPKLDEVLTSEPGKPSTYNAPNTVVGKVGFTEYSDNLVETNHDSTTTRQTFTNETMSSENKSVTHNINTNFEGVYNMALIGIDFSAGFGTSSMTMDISGMNRTGAVGPLPSDVTKEQYNFNWRFVTWMEEFENEEKQKYSVPVLAYEVADVVEERKAPVLTALATADDSIELSWVDSSAEVGDGTVYDLYRVQEVPVVGTQYYQVTPDTGITELKFTDTGLSSNTEYKYVVTATTPQVNPGIGEPTEKISPYSNEALATTFALGDDIGITIDPQPTSETVEVGLGASFTVGAKRTADNSTNGLQYFWQELKPNSSAWANISGANSATLSVPATTLADSGTLYRCMVFDSLSGYGLFSDTAELTVVLDLIMGSTTDIIAVDGIKGAIADNAVVAKNDILDIDTNILLDDKSIPQNSKIVITLTANGKGHTYTTYFSDRTSPVLESRIKLEDLGLNVGDSFTLQSELFSTSEFVGSKSATKTYTVGDGVSETYTLQGLKDTYVYSEVIDGVTTYNNVTSSQLTDAEISHYNVLGVYNGIISPFSVISFNTYSIDDLILDVGEYWIVAYGETSGEFSEELTRKHITVTKKPITITAPTDNTPLTTAEVLNHTVTGNVSTNGETLVSSNPHYVGLMPYTPPTMSVFDMFTVGIAKEVDGYYPVVNYSGATTGNIQEQIEFFQKNYQPTFEKGAALNVSDFVSARYEIEFSSENSEGAEFGSLSAFSREDGYFATGATAVEGDKITFTVNAGAQGIPAVVKWNVNGVDITSQNMGNYGMTTPTDTVLTISNLSQNMAVNVVLDDSKFSHIVTAISDDNGTISPSGQILVENGGSKTFTFSPKEGYQIGELLVDGAKIAFSGNTYTVSDIIKPTSVQVSFAEIPLEKYTISFDANGGSKDMDNMEAVQNTISYLPENGFTPPDGKVFKEWAIGSKDSGIRVSANGTHTFTGNTTVYAVWMDEDITVYTVKASSDENGTITPSGDVKVEEGKNQSFTFTANDKYELDIVLVDGNEVQAAGNSYTIENVRKDMSISVTFSRITIKEEEKVIIKEEIEGKEDEEGITNGVVDEKEMEEIVDDVIKEAIEEGKAPIVNITMKTPVDSKGVSITLPAEQLKKLGAVDGAVLTLDCGEYQATFDSKAISAMSENGDDKIVVEVINTDKSKLTAAQQSKVGANPVYDLSIKSGDTVITDFKGGSAIITLPYELQSGQSKENVVVYYLDSNGQIQAMPTVYDEATKTVSFTTPHFSYYYVANNVTVSPTTNPEAPQTGDDNNTVWLFTAILISAALLTALTMIKRKKVKK